jgi:hypothetical protein
VASFFIRDLVNLSYDKDRVSRSECRRGAGSGLAIGYRLLAIGYHSRPLPGFATLDRRHYHSQTANVIG